MPNPSDDYIEIVKNTRKLTNDICEGDWKLLIKNMYGQVQHIAIPNKDQDVDLWASQYDFEGLEIRKDERVKSC